MVVKVFEFNKNHKIEFTKEELETLLDEIYNNGYRDGSYRHWTWTSPTWPNWTYSNSGTGKECHLDDYITYTTTSASSDDPSHVTINVGAYPKNDSVTIN